ncbi:MAG: universal stress protein [Gemmatimonadota bacterium]
MYRIMVPLDGSAFAEQALPLAVAIARRTGAQLHVITVRASYPIETELNEGNNYVREVAAQIQSQLPEPIIAQAITNELAALHYHPPESSLVSTILASHAEEQQIDLILMTTHGRGGLQRSWLGSVTDSLTRTASCPLLVARPTEQPFSLAAPADRGLNHILIPLDGSPAAEQAISEARQLGDPFDARYTLLRVISPLAQLTVGTDLYPIEYTAPRSRKAAVQYLDTVAARLRHEGLAVDTRVVEDTSPAPAILSYASAHAADLIALTTTGVGGIRRFLLGSVADKLVRSGNVPTLLCTVRPGQAQDTGVAALAAAASDAS